MQTTFHTPGAVTVDVRLASGDVRVEAVDTTDTEVTVEALDETAQEQIDDVRVELHESGDGATVVVDVPERKGRFGFSLIRSPQFSVRVRCPLDASLVLKSVSADLDARGRLGSVNAKTASGDLRVAEASGRVEVNSASGDLQVGDVAGPVNVGTASGDVDIRRARGDVRAQLVSGDLSLGEAGGAVEANTVSGDQRLDLVGGGDVNSRSISGDVTVGVRRGTVVWLDVRSVSGDTVSELDVEDGAPPAAGTPLELRVNTVSGDVRIHRAGSPLGAEA